MTEPMPIEARLQALPRKVSAPLSQLLKVGQLSEEVLSVVLDAGEMAGETSKLLGFTIGFLYLRGRGIGVADVIRMSRAQGRSIRLDWSAKRWETEHNRLARAETLKRLSERNVRYDVAAYAACLPPGFKGYLIPSSRRLGMEGLRQGHCVASYDAEVRAGHSAIAAMFVERERWTVQLALTGSGTDPLRVAQIRGRLNKVPPAKVRKAILAQLGIGLCPSVLESEAGAPVRSYVENLRRVLPVLRELHVRKVVVSFDGCGDSGSIDEVSYGNATPDAANVQVEVEVCDKVFEVDRWVDRRQLECRTLDVAIEELTNDYLDETQVNWYDNDGGFGELTIDVEAGTVTLDVNVRCTESSGEYWRTLDIQTGEEI